MSTRRGILAALEEAGGFVSGEDLAARLGISRAAVWKHVAALKHGGYEIEGARCARLPARRAAVGAEPRRRSARAPPACASAGASSCST